MSGAQDTENTKFLYSTPFLKSRVEWGLFVDFVDHSVFSYKHVGHPEPARPLQEQISVLGKAEATVKFEQSRKSCVLSPSPERNTASRSGVSQQSPHTSCGNL